MIFSIIVLLGLVIVLGSSLYVALCDNGKMQAEYDDQLRKSVEWRLISEQTSRKFKTLEKENDTLKSENNNLKAQIASVKTAIGINDEHSVY